MSRSKIALGAVVIAGAALLIAIAMWPRRLEKLQQKSTDPIRRVVGKEENASAKSSKSDNVLQSFGKLSGEPDEPGSNSPRMQGKQIKMH
jgi:hypothetical protein